MNRKFYKKTVCYIGFSGIVFVFFSILSSLINAAEDTQRDAVIRTVMGDNSAGQASSFSCKTNNGDKRIYGVKKYDVGAVNLAYVEGPDTGPALVILPGMSVPWQSYIKTAELLCKHFHLFIVTQRGHDITGWATDRAYHVSDYGRDVTRLIREVIKEPVIISGHSLGGLVALWVASTQQDIVIGFNAEDGAFLVNEKQRWQDSWVKALFVGLEQRLRAYHEQGASIEEVTHMFAESRLVLPSVHMSYERRIIGLGKTLSLNRHSGMPPLSTQDKPHIHAGYKKYLSGIAPRNSEFWPPAVLRAATIASLHLDPEVARASVTTELVAGFDNREAFAKVRAPMLYWESDREMVGVISPSDHSSLVATVRNNNIRAEHIYVEGSGHRIHFDRPEKFADEITRFFKQSRGLSI